MPGVMRLRSTVQPAWSITMHVRLNQETRGPRVLFHGVAWHK